MMKIMLLADAGSAHTRRWAAALLESGYQLTLVTLSGSLPDDLARHPRLRFHSLNTSRSRQKGPLLGKLTYLRLLPALKKLIRQEQPDILHAHYASSYGLLGALTGFHPFVVSVWGSDVYLFP